MGNVEVTLGEDNCREIAIPLTIGFSRYLMIPPVMANSDWVVCRLSGSELSQSIRHSYCNQSCQRNRNGGLCGSANNRINFQGHGQNANEDYNTE